MRLMTPITGNRLDCSLGSRPRARASQTSHRADRDSAVSIVSSRNLRAIVRARHSAFRCGGIARPGFARQGKNADAASARNVKGRVAGGTVMSEPENAVPTTSDPKDLHDLLKEFSTVLLGTFEQNGERPSLRARPMSIARLDSDCSLYFITQASTDKVEEASATRFGHVFAQSKTRFGSLQGELVISRDRALIRQLWSKACEVWLDGPDDPNAAVIVFRTHEAELWDLSGTKGLRFLLESARALATGDKRPDYPTKMHERVQMR